MTLTITPFTATILGSPRIGPHRELKRATERTGPAGPDAVELESSPPTCAATPGRAARRRPGLVPVNTFSYYDQMLDTAVMLGALPPRVAAIDDDLDRYFAAARGNGESPRWR